MATRVRAFDADLRVAGVLHFQFTRGRGRADPNAAAGADQKLITAGGSEISTS